MGNPPMFGDYEAHRHWMEVTVNLPMRDWCGRQAVRSAPGGSHAASPAPSPPPSLARGAGIAARPTTTSPTGGWTTRRLRPTRWVGLLLVACCAGASWWWPCARPPPARATHPAVQPLLARLHAPPGGATRPARAQSWLCGRALLLYEPAALALGASRGYETPSSKLFMRGITLALDLAFLFPAALACSAVFAPAGARRQRRLLLVALLFSPALLLVDHGHYQYNGMSLGLAAGAAAATASGHDVLGAVLYSLSLNHKQMGLYFAPAFFAHMLGRCLQRRGLGAKVRGGGGGGWGLLSWEALPRGAPRARPPVSVPCPVPHCPAPCPSPPAGGSGAPGPRCGRHLPGGVGALSAVGAGAHCGAPHLPPAARAV